MTTDKIHVPYSQETRVALLEQSINNINNTLLRFEKRFDAIDQDIKDLRKEMIFNFRGMFAVFGGLLLTLTGVMSHGFHWV